MKVGECYPQKISVVVVIYKTAIEDSITLNSIKKSVANNPHLQTIYTFILVNNGPQNLQDVKQDSNFIVINNSINSISHAYNLALKVAEELDSDWLLLMDQDTEIDQHFLEKLAEDSEKLNFHGSVVCIVPTIFDGITQISPSRRFPGGVHRPLRKYKEYIGGEIYAIGSCSSIRLSFLKELKGFDERYVIDSVDRWLFKQIAIRGKLIYLLKGRIRHNLSVRNYEKLSEARYKSIINSELYFIKEHYSIFDRLIYALRIVIRIIYFSFFEKNMKLSRITFSHIKNIFM